MVSVFKSIIYPGGYIARADFLIEKFSTVWQNVNHTSIRRTGHTCTTPFAALRH